MVHINPQYLDFHYQDETLLAQPIDTYMVIPGVSCTVYAFEGDKTRDLASIVIGLGQHTPRQKLVKGIETVEILKSGRGKFFLKRGDLEEIYEVDSQNSPFSIKLEIGDIVQWIAANDSILSIYEICTPPFEAGRFDNIVEP